MKIFPYYWGRPEAEFEVVGTPDGPCAQCGGFFTEDDLGVLLPHFADDVLELPWHRHCLLESMGIEEDKEGEPPIEPEGEMH